MNTNKQLMTRIFERVGQGDGSLFSEHLADNVEMTITGQYSWSQTFKGKESVLNDLYAYVASVTELPRKTIALNIIAEGEYVVVEAKGQMTSKKGIPYNNDYCLIFRLQEGKIIEYKEYQDSTLCERVLGAYPNKGEVRKSLI
ncbi:nuclear transport factor 2 family protein [Aurantivibrio infirmus]